MLYRLITGATQIPDAEGNLIQYEAWDNNILDLTPSQAKSLGRRVMPLGESEDIAPAPTSVAPETPDPHVVPPRRRRR